MRCKKIYQIAKEIDNLSKVRTKDILKKLEKFSPKFLGRGKYKRAFLITCISKEYVFKIGELIQVDKQIFESLRYNRKMSYAKIYWTTEKCLLQRKCEIVDLSDEEIKLRKKNAKLLGYSDARKSNLGMNNGKIIAFDLKPIGEIK